MTPEEIEKLLARLSVTVDMHAVFLTVLIVSFLADYPVQKQRMVDALNGMKQLPEYAAANFQEAIERVARALQDVTPLVH
jgi:hypothetical protein